MKRRIALLITWFLIGSIDLALAGNLPIQKNDTAENLAIAKARNAEMRKRLNLPVRLPIDREVYPPSRDKRPHPDRGCPYPATQTTVVREVQPIIIVNPPAPETPPALPEGQYVWVPPVTETRTEAGHWDYGIKKTWRGDHWRYSQDFSEKTWVPETQVEVVKQAGYWDIVR